MKHLTALLCGLLLSTAALAAGPTATVTWTAPTTNTDGSAIAGALTYNVYQGTGTATPVKVQGPVAALTVTITAGLAAGSTQCFTVSAVANGVEGPQSLPACVTLQASAPSAPPTPTVTIS